MKKNALFEVSFKLLLKNKKGESLILVPNKKYCLYPGYDIPGGRINASEIDLDIKRLIDREVREELGPKVRYKLDPRSACFSVASFKTKEKPNRDGVLYFVFDGKYLGGEIKLSSEHDEYFWKKVTLKDSSKFVHIYVNLIREYFKAKKI